MFTLSAKFSADVVCVCGQVPSVCAGSRPTCSQSVPQSAGVPALGTYILSAPLLCCRVVGGFDTLTAMETVESDPKTDRPKVRAPEQRALSLGSELGGWQAAGGPAHAHLPRQEEIRVDSTIVFVDPYEEADAQVRKGLGGRLCPRPAQFCPRSPTWASA